MTSQAQRFSGPARALLVIEHRVLADVVTLALGHGHYTIRVARTDLEATMALADWQPHLVILDMDLAGSGILERCADTSPEIRRLPVIALTRRGNLAAKLAAFEQGVDDILVVPTALTYEPGGSQVRLLQGALTHSTNYSSLRTAFVG
jgi:two-component system OmpR family response regulator